MADLGNSTIRKITPAGVVTTLAGTVGVSGSSDGTGATASFNDPQGIATDSTGNVYVANYGSATTRKITPAGVVTTLAGTAGVSGSTDGTGAAASFNQIFGIATDSEGNIFVADSGNNTIRKITPAGVVTTLAGTAGVRDSTDGTGAAASFNNPRGIATDSAGNIFVADTGNSTIRKITPAGVVTTLVGTAGVVGSTDGTGAAAIFNQPYGIATDSAENIYVADVSNNTIRKITPAGVVTTIVGNGMHGFFPGSLPGGLGYPRSVALSGATLYTTSGNGIVQITNYAAALACQTIAFGTAPTVNVGGTGTVSATASSGLAITYGSTTSSVCAVSGNTVTALATGICTITADQAGDANYNAATQATQNITIGKGSQSINFGTAPTVVVGGTGTVSATGGASGNTVTFSSTTTGVCTVGGNIVTGIAAGICTITADQAGDTNYNAATQATQSFTVAPITTLVHLEKGWNLIGSGGTTSFDVAAYFGDIKKVTTVWKWLADRSQWAFYTPMLDAAALQTYAASKLYAVLSTIDGRDGFWVNALEAQDIAIPFGSTYTAISHRANLLTGWNLIAVGEQLTPVRFNNYLTPYTGNMPPEIGSATTTTVYQANITTLWAWNTAVSGWLFYAPSLQSTNELGNYAARKGYFDFTVSNKTLGPGVGFWVNKP